MKFVLSAVSEREAIAPGGPLRGRLGDAAELVRGRLELKRLDMEQAGRVGLVGVPALDDALGLAAVEEELDGLAEPVVHHGIEAHDVSQRAGA